MDFTVSNFTRLHTNINCLYVILSTSNCLLLCFPSFTQLLHHTSITHYPCMKPKLLSLLRSWKTCLDSDQSGLCITHETLCWSHFHVNRFYTDTESSWSNPRDDRDTGWL